MPELPEIETLIFQLKKALEGQRIAEVKIWNGSVVKTPRPELEWGIRGKRITQIGRRGKFIRFDLSENWILWFHLGMTGQVIYEDPPDTLRPHTHLILSFTDSPRRLFYRDVRRFGQIFFTRSDEKKWPEAVRNLGLEPRAWRAKEFARRFHERRARIKNLLLNQRLVAGLGNIYSDEALHRAGIHPLRQAERIPFPHLLLLHTAICEVLQEAIRHGGSSIDDYVHLDGTRGGFQRFHRVYGRVGEKCLLCGTPIQKVKISGRSACFCPHCQQ